MRPTFNPGVQLTGTGSCVGDRVLSNAELEPLIHGYDPTRSGPFGAWVDQVTHIHERPYAPPGCRTTDLSIPAAKAALEMAGIGAKDLDLIIYATFTPSTCVPGDHAVLAEAIGASRCPNFQLMGACAGSIYGMGVAYGMLASGVARHVLVVGAETITPVVNYHDPLTAILFGDGAGAAVLSRVEGAPAGTGMLPPHLGFEFSPNAIQVGNSNLGTGMRCFPPTLDQPGLGLVEKSVVVMNGGASVLRNAVNNMAECTVRTLGYELADLKAGDPDLRAILDGAWLVPHQANGRIVEGLADKLSMTKVIRTIYRYANMSAASNLVALDHGMRKGNLERILDADGKVLGIRETPDRFRKGETILLPSIGGGYLMGCVGLKLGCAGA